MEIHKEIICNKLSQLIQTEDINQFPGCPHFWWTPRAPVDHFLFSLIRNFAMHPTPFGVARESYPRSYLMKGGIHYDHRAKKLYTLQTDNDSYLHSCIKINLPQHGTLHHHQYWQNAK